MVTRTNRVFLALSVLALGCGGSAMSSQGSGASGGSGAGPSSGGNDSTGGSPALGGTGGGTTDPPDSSSGLTVHEWGTYTSVHATDGHALGGVHHVDEALPSWVHRREFSPQSYFFEALPEEPHEQLETPVLYFHSAVAREVKVDVNFPEGIVGEWFPEASAYTPAQGAMTALGQGSMSWLVGLDPALASSSFLPVSPDEIWAPSRNVASTPLRATDANGVEEREQFIFYRGLAKFEPPFRTRVLADTSIELENASSELLSAVFVLTRSGENGAFVSLGALGPGQTLTTSFPKADASLDAFVDSARTGLHAALVATGLYPDEAQAMVDTWTRSWFKNEGTRILYLAPRAWTDQWLPMNVNPTPSELVRTLVGRVELLSPDDEQSLVAELGAAAQTGTWPSIESLGRFAEPRLARAIEQLTDPKALELAQSMHDSVHSQP